MRFDTHESDASLSCLDEEHVNFVTQSNKTTEKFQQLIQTMTLELTEVYRSSAETTPPRVELIEVFCGPRSELTHQVNQLGGKAIRFSLTEGDLSDCNARRKLFEWIIQYKPKHLWFSPTCGPWSPWSNLNQSRSIEHFDDVNRQRMANLYQLALGVVLFRWQVSHERHMHWEQPQRSLMFKTPLLQEMFGHTVEAHFDMCRVGELRDPQNQKLIKKGMALRTTSMELARQLHGRVCNHQHDHQSLAGSCKVGNRWMARTSFSEQYSRKFARYVAKLLLKLRWPLEKPCSWMKVEDVAVMTVLDGEPPMKRLRVEPNQSTSRGRGNPFASLKPVNYRAPELCLPNKRRRIEGKSQPEMSNSKVLNEKCEKLMTLVEKTMPRVGKKQIVDPVVLNLLQELLHDKTVIRVVACKGTDRTLGPPKDLIAGEAPFRRSIIRHRHSGEILVEQQWEQWEELANRQVVRKAEPARVNITVFAANPRGTESSDQQSPPAENAAVEPTDCVAPNPSLPSERTTLQDAPEMEQSLPRTSQIDLTCGKHGPMFNSLTSAQKSWLLKVHANLGHPGSTQLTEVLRMQGYPSEVINGLKDMKCSVCVQNQSPKIPRPSALRSNFDFNDKISMDGITWTNAQNQTFHFYHVLDLGTNFQVAFPAPNRSASHVIDHVLQSWFSWAGAPNELITDAATEFSSEEFTTFLRQFNVKGTCIAPEAHWQLGRTERHGAVLQEMLTKFEADHPIDSNADLRSALTHCCQAKNACSLRGGFAQEMLVFGKQTRLPGSITGDDTMPSHSLADEESGQGIQFRTILAKRESARKAFHQADNSSVIRRAALRRTRPQRDRYEPGEWVMMWKESATRRGWIGPMKVVSQVGNHTIWCTHYGKLCSAAPEHVRLTSSVETQSTELSRQEAMEESNQDLRTNPNSDQTGIPPPSGNRSETEPSSRTLQLNREESLSRRNSQSTEEQPEPENAESVSESMPEAMPMPEETIDASAVPVPTDGEDELVCETFFVSTDVQECVCLSQSHEDLAWRFEVDVSAEEMLFCCENETEAEALIIAASKKQHTEVKLSTLNAEEKAEFDAAKGKEIENWLKTNTVKKILRNHLAPEQVLRCRWILTWKALDAEDQKLLKKTHKAKARLVVLGYLDPELESIQRDSPTLNRQSRMLALQLIATMGWTVQSFDIKSAFLQGSRDDARILGVEPVEELRKAMKLKENEIVQLTKSAYGLIDAPHAWYQELNRKLQGLGFQRSPFDPCLYTLFRPGNATPSGILGVHVDDGLCGGDRFFEEKLQQLEKIFPFGSKRSGNFTFTGIDISQKTDSSIVLSQEKYVGKIEPIKISANRRTSLDAHVSPEEKHALRALVGSLQYAAVNTRPDLSSRLSHLQSQINVATVSTLLEANKTLHEAKRHQDVAIRIQPIPIQKVRFLAFSDASFSSPKEPDSHAGLVIMTTHADILKNSTCPVNAMSWGCKKIQKVVVSTLSAETMSLNAALDQQSWLRLYWGWILDPKLSWKNPHDVLQNLPETIETTPKAIAVTDCKSLFDLVTRTAPPNCQEFRTQLQARAIKDLLREGVSLRWVHTGAQLADALTKVMENSFLRYTLKHGSYKLHDETEVLKERANARNRIKWLDQGTASKIS